VPRHVIGVGMGNEGPRLPAAKVDRQVSFRQLESAIEMEHWQQGLGISGRGLEFGIASLDQND
jgi:hypothetical protein